jgi:hypothetical protein
VDGHENPVGGGELCVLPAPFGNRQCYVLKQHGSTTFVVVDENATPEEVDHILEEVKETAGLPALLATLGHLAGECDKPAGS